MRPADGWKLSDDLQSTAGKRLQKMPAGLRGPDLTEDHNLKRSLDMRDLYDVIEVGMEKPHKVEVIDCLKSAKNADAIVKAQAAAKQGKPHFFKAVPTGEYRDGQQFRF
jgi:hypothetical protein